MPTCICSAISETRYHTQLVVLQHLAEVKHAKNTARLISLVAPDTKIVVGETAEDFCDVRSQYAADPGAVVLYPAAGSASLNECATHAPIKTLIIIDGTWRKAKRIWLSNPWLHSMRVCHLEDVGGSNYRIRSGSVDGGLASIEAAAHALQLLGETDTQALLDAFMALQRNWPAHGEA